MKRKPEPHVCLACLQKPSITRKAPDGQAPLADAVKIACSVHSGTVAFGKTLADAVRSWNDKIAKKLADRQAKQNAEARETARLAAVAEEAQRVEEAAQQNVPTVDAALVGTVEMSSSDGIAIGQTAFVDVEGADGIGFGHLPSSNLGDE